MKDRLPATLRNLVIAAFATAALAVACSGSDATERAPAGDAGSTGALCSPPQCACTGCFLLCQCNDPNKDASACLAECAGAQGGAGGQGGMPGAGGSGAVAGMGGVAGTAGTGGTATAGMGGVGMAGTGGNPGNNCTGPQDCSGNMSLGAPGCCTPGGKCGYDTSSLIGLGCIEKNQPGNVSAQCQPVALTAGIMLQGCCKPTGQCGYMDTFLGLGCVDPTQFGQSSGPCTP